jgi:hypothetical protein
MPGDYLFPKRLFKSGEPLDTVELNDALQVAAERLNGHLGPHNIRAPLSPSLTSEAGTFFRTKVATVDVDPQMECATSGSDGQSPQPSAQDAFLLEQQTGWQVVEGSTDMAIDIATGASSLAITAQATHCFAGDYDGSRSVYEVVVPLIDDPDLAYGRKSNAKDITVRVVLEGGTSTELDLSFTEMPVGDTRNFANKHDQSKAIAKQISEGCQGASTSTGSDARAVQDNGWNAKGYEVRAVGRTLRFTKLAEGATSGTFSIGYAWNTLARSGSASTTMTQVRAGGTSTAIESLSDLSSATTSAGLPSGTAAEVVVYFPAQIQYAIRVDGVVLTETITGRFDNEQAPLAPARIVAPRDEDAVTDSDGVNTELGGISGPMIGRFRERPDAINIPMFSVRLTASIEVEPGDHVVELVVRRVPTGRRRSFVPPPPGVGNASSIIQYISPKNRIYIYSRQMSVTDVPVEPVESAPFGNPSVVYSFKDEDVVTKVNLVDEKLQRVANQTNSLDSFQVARGAINGDHLEGFSSVIASGAASRSFVSEALFSNIHTYDYPSGTPTFFGNNRPFYPLAGSAWKKLLEVPFVLEREQECVLTVEANVFIDRLVNMSKSQKQMHLAAACFLIAVRASATGNIFAWRPSLAWVNSNNYFAYQRSKTSTELYPSSGSTPTGTIGINYLSRYTPGRSSPLTSGEAPGDFVDVPVTAYIDFSGEIVGSPLPRRVSVAIDRVYLYGAASFMGAAGNEARAFIKHMSLNAVAMKS